VLLCLNVYTLNLYLLYLLSIYFLQCISTAEDENIIKKEKQPKEKQQIIDVKIPKEAKVKNSKRSKSKKSKRMN
jgi:hypothetical protein